MAVDREINAIFEEAANLYSQLEEIIEIVFGKLTDEIEQCVEQIESDKEGWSERISNGQLVQIIAYYGRSLVDIEERIANLNYRFRSISRLESVNSNVLEQKWEAVMLDFYAKKNIFTAYIDILCSIHAVQKLSDDIIAFDKKNDTASSQTHSNPKLSVAVVAPMSSGKSTLLNALLGRELLPSKNEACTATITIIEQDNQAEDFSAEILNEAQEILMSLPTVQPEVLDNLNEQEGVTYIHLKGPIPTLYTEKQQVLELIDTPGPNNSRDAQHKMLTQTVLQNHPFDFILYVLNATQLGINDDYLLLHDVIQIASKDGQRDKNERVIFILNKCDELDAEDGESINIIMQSVQDYLREVGFTQPRIIPVSALAARLIRQKQSGEILTRKEERDYDIYLSDGGLQHLEQYAQIPQKMKEKLTQQLKAAKQSGNQEKIALLHTGIPVLEMVLDNMLD